MHVNAAQGSFGELLVALHSLFPSALVGEPGWKRLLALAHRLPIHVIDYRFGFEFDLCDPDPVADFCVVPIPGSRLAEFYVRQGKACPQESAEAALGAFLAQKASHNALFADGSGGVILEYDLVGISSEQPAPPGIFIVTGDAPNESCIRKLLGDPDALAAELWAVAGWTPDAAIQQQMRQIYRLMQPMGGASLRPVFCRAGHNGRFASSSAPNPARTPSRCWPGSGGPVPRQKPPPYVRAWQS